MAVYRRAESQPEFTAYCITEEADQALHDGALAMAWTAIDVVKDDDLRNRPIAGA